MDMVAHAEINNLSFVYADENKKSVTAYFSFCSKRWSLLLCWRIGIWEDDVIKTF